MVGLCYHQEIDGRSKPEPVGAGLGTGFFWPGTIKKVKKIFLNFENKLNNIFFNYKKY